MNSVLNTIKNRFSCRNFKSQMPDNESLQLIAEAAVQAPSAMNRQCWQIIIVKNNDLIKEMETEGLHYLAQMPDQTMYERIKERGKGLFYNAPCMMLVPIEASDAVGASLDCGIVCQNITLSATSLGIDNLICGLAGLAFASDKADYFKERLGFPKGYEFGAAILLGFAREETKPHEPDLQKISYIE